MRAEDEGAQLLPDDSSFTNAINVGTTPFVVRHALHGTAIARGVFVFRLQTFEHAHALHPG